MNRTLALAAATAVVLAMPAATTAKRPDHAGTKSKGATVLKVDLHPLNGSGVEGRAVLIDKGDRLRVIIRAKGLEPGKPHPQHIHGLSGSTEATCPTPDAANDRPGLPEEAANPEEFISIEEGAPFYGPPLLFLEPFPVANPAGVVTYSERFTNISGDLQDLRDEVIVLHGMTLAGGYAATLPVACGEIPG